MLEDARKKELSNAASQLLKTFAIDSLEVSDRNMQLLAPLEEEQKFLKAEMFRIGKLRLKYLNILSKKKTKKEVFKLLKFDVDFGRMGDLAGVFIVNLEEWELIQDNQDKHLYFGEALGKHSDISLGVSECGLKVASEDQDLCAKLNEIFSGGHISGIDFLSTLLEAIEDAKYDEE